LRGRVNRRTVHQYVASTQLEQRVVVHAPGCADGLAECCVDLSHGPGIPTQNVIEIDIALGRSHRHRLDHPQLDVYRRRFGGQEAT
jgi:hypothetical protein